jgi:hypothetical protein
MRTSSFLVIYVGALLSGCNPIDPMNSCNSYQGPGESAAIADELIRGKVAFLNDGQTLCYRSRDAQAFHQARNAAYEYYRAVATVIPNEETEKRLTERLTLDKKYYSLSPASNGRRLLVLHSLNPQEVEVNREYLQRIQKGQ